VKTSKEFTFDMHYYALEATLRYYEKNKGFFGECPKMDKMLKSTRKKANCARSRNASSPYPPPNK
jgi:hypothetical protein